jgi:pimeloyl-ACP methyl ester carboxylesterase
MSAARFTVRSSDGTPIVSFRSGDGPPLILLHGTTTDHTRWSPILAELERRFTVFAVDRRGRGASGDAAAYALEREAEDLLALLDAIGRPAAVIGHSYGALVTVEALARGARPDRTVIYEPPFATGIELYTDPLLHCMEALLAAGDRAAVVTTFFRDVALLSPGALDLLRAAPEWPERLAAAHTIPREMRASTSYVLDPTRFSTVDTPVLLLLGGDSPAIFKRPSERVRAAVPGSRIALLPGQQHVAMSTAPALFLQEVLAELTGRQVPG